MCYLKFKVGKQLAQFSFELGIIHKARWADARTSLEVNNYNIKLQHKAESSTGIRTWIMQGQVYTKVAHYS
jgi:hypothetical protein